MIEYPKEYKNIKKKQGKTYFFRAKSSTLELLYEGYLSN